MADDPRCCTPEFGACPLIYPNWTAEQKMECYRRLGKTIPEKVHRAAAKIWVENEQEMARQREAAES